MKNGQFTNTSINMVQVITNIIEDYRMGSFRALAQEPVQNALDAMREGQGTVSVEYRLLRRKMPDGSDCYLLTVTDTGTTGLRGDMVTAEELQARHFKLGPDENWAAFEAQGYTKENEDALGSRGQGKAAFLYHSHVPGETRRMLMLYDTLLEDGEYRFGMRFARPIDQTLSPPQYNADAKAIIEREYYQLDDNLDIPLGLHPLRDIGSRIIVPYLDKEEVQLFRPGGELGRWLQRCWWRAIQTGKLCIRVIDDENTTEEEIAVPGWWQGLPRERGKPKEYGSWSDLPYGGRVCVWGELQLGDGQQIRRLVLLHSDSLGEDEIVKDHPEFAGIQVLRGSQWIETRGVREDYGDYIPLEKRPGLRGYVEFDKKTDGELRKSEYSTHDGFDGKRAIVRAIRNELAARVREFSQEMGWEQPQAISNQQVSQREKQTHSRFLETFLNPNGRKPQSLSANGGTETPQLLWDCRLGLDYPDPKSARVDWGQAISNVYVTVAFEPGDALFGSADLLLEWVDATGKPQEVNRREEAIDKKWNQDRVEEQFELGDWQILRGKTNRARQIECPEPGECKLRAVIVYRGERVRSAARTVYVQTDPPPPPQKNPVTLSISAENISASDQKRIDHSQVLQLQFNARNRMTKADTYYLSASFANEIFARDLPVELEGTPAGDTAQRQEVLTEKRQLLDPQRAAPLMLDRIQQLKMPDSSGKYTISADLYDKTGEIVAHASSTVYFQHDPGKANSKLPFEIEQKVQDPMWELNEELTVLTYSGDYPLYKELQVPQRQRRSLQGRLAFIAEISANGLLEWALRPKEQGDDSNFDQLLDDSGGQDDSLWETYIRRLENLSNSHSESFIKSGHIWRETVAAMLDIFRKEDN